MITVQKIARIFFISTILVIYGCNPKDNNYFKTQYIQSEIEKEIELLLKEQLKAKYITVYFTSSKNGKIYVFITDEIGAYNYRSSYYFKKEGKQIIIGYKTKELENRFANQKLKKPERIFDDSEALEFYHGKQIVYEILNDNKIKEIKMTQEIWELNDFMEFEPLPLPPPDK